MVSQPPIERIRSEFLEMPGLRLTADQIHRLCGVERGQCTGILDTLVRDKFLRANPDGTYARFTDDQRTQMSWRAS
jgi:hypothetical protein